MKTLQERRSFTFFSLLPLVILAILLILPYGYAQSYDNKFTYNESIEGLTVADATAEIDGTTLVRLQKAAGDPQCAFTKDIYLRIILPNNTVIASTPQLNMSSYNYCSNFTSTSRISMISLIEGWVYLTYLEDVGVAQFQQYGVPISYNGTVGEIKLLMNYDDGFPGSIYRSMIPEAGFLFAKVVREDRSIIWRRYSTVTEDGKIYALGNGTFAPNLRDGTQTFGSNIFRTIDGGYGCAFVTTNLDAQNPKTATTSQWSLQVLFLHPDTNKVSKPSNVWTSPAGVSDVQLGNNACNIAYDGSGYVCVLLVSTGQTQTLRQVNFYSTGASYDSFTLGFDPKDVAAADRISPLFYGGYMIVNLVDSTRRVAQNVIMLDPSGKVAKTIKLVSQVFIVNVYARNNTAWHWMNDSPQSWSIVSYYLPKFTTNGIDYQNPNVVTTSPTIGEEIPIRKTDVSITYNMQVKPNTGNVTIYATDGINKFLRQTYSPVYLQYWTIDAQNETVTLQVLNSTFNQPNMTYFLVLENGFVSSKDTEESILGIAAGKWSFHTSSVQPQDIYSPGATAIISLTAWGSSHFLGLSNADRSNLLSSLSNSLASIVPASPNRLSISTKFQIDSKTGQDRVLLSLKVSSATSSSEMGVDSVLKDLDVLIRNKAITAASRIPETVLVDENYGVHIKPNLWDEYKLDILIAGAAVFLIGLLYLLACRINPEAQNGAIFTLTLVLYDFAVDVAFIVSNGKDVPSLYVPSILILIVTVVYSMSMALYIMISENTRSYKFHLWTQSYSQVAAIFTVIAAADIEVLTVIGSKLCKSPFFSAPFSERAHHMVFWASTGSFFLEDVPQFIVQVIYQNNTITYDIIPLLSLVSASVMLVINFITRVYYGITLVRARKATSHLGSADESASISDSMDTKEITDESYLSFR